MEYVKSVLKHKFVHYFILIAITIIVLNFATLDAEKKTIIDLSQGSSIVYFTTNINEDSVLKLFEQIKPNVKGKIGLKVHFGEKGNTYFVRSELYKKLQKETNGNFVETNVIYPGPRRETESHVALAKEHGFTYAPIDILDKNGEIAIPVKTKHFNEVYVGKGFSDYDTYIVCSHFKGHAMAGFGGAIKNISMGIGSRKGKMSLHAAHYPCVDTDKCINCGLCVKSCATKAISLNPLRIDPTKCVGCGKCIAECPQKALTNQDKDNQLRLFHEKLADYAKGISEKTNMIYINFVYNVSPDCDCSSHPDKPFVHDIGILASTDPVALDKASMDLVNKAANSEDAFYEVNKVSGQYLIEYCQRIGLGNMKYQLITIK